MKYQLIKRRSLGGAYSVNPLPSQQDLHNFYNQYWQTPNRPHTSSYTRAELMYLESKFNVLLSLVPIKNYEALDIGCGEGHLLKKLTQDKIKATGIDFNDFGISKFNPSVLSKFKKGDIMQLIHQLILKGKKFDVVFLNHVIEHVLDPRKLLQSIYQIINENGYLVASVPNDMSQLQISLKQKKFYKKNYFVRLPDHLHYFTAVSLKSLLDKSQFEFVDGIADFPIEWYLANKHSNYAINAQLGKEAHHARVYLENLINTGDTNKAAQFWRSLFEIGQGRSITIIAKPKLISVSK